MLRCAIRLRSCLESESARTERQRFLAEGIRRVDAGWTSDVSLGMQLIQDPHLDAGEFGAGGHFQDPRPFQGHRDFLFQDSGAPPHDRSEEHTSELQSLMRISYAVFCLKKKL